MDDTILIGKASIREAQIMKTILDKYERASDQKVNYDKISNQISQIFQCQLGSLLSTYLGMPLFEGCIQITFWHKVMDILKNKMAGWKEFLLILAGKIQHAKASLQRILVYTASIFKIPSLVANRND